MNRQEKILLRTTTAEALYGYITELISISPWEKLLADEIHYPRCNELYIMNIEREQILKKLQESERKGKLEVKLTFNRIALQVLANNVPLGVGCDGFVGEAMKHVKVNYINLEM